MDERVDYMTTAAGKICCRRCLARSKGTGQQCKKPALKTSRTQKCQLHGGKSTGPVTEEGRQRCAKAKLVHGRETKAKRAQAAEMNRLLRVYARILGIRYRLDFYPVRPKRDPSIR